MNSYLLLSTTQTLKNLKILQSGSGSDGRSEKQEGLSGQNTDKHYIKSGREDEVRGTIRRGGSGDR